MKKLLKQLAFVLVVAGALNWGLTAFNYNILANLLGTMPTLLKVVYGAIGAAGIVTIYHAVKK